MKIATLIAATLLACAPAHAAEDFNIRITVESSDHLATCKRADAILKSRNKLGKSERDAWLYEDGQIDIRRCIEVIVGDALLRAHPATLLVAPTRIGRKDSL